MTFTEMVQEVADRTGMNSQTGLALIGRAVNERYRQMASSVGFSMVQRTTATATSTAGQQTITFGPTPTPVQKILAVYDATVSPVRMLDEFSVDTIRSGFLVTAAATQYANNYQTTAKSVTILVNSKATTPYTLTADVLSNLTNLTGVQTPNFAEDFHDALVKGAMATVFDSKEKTALAGKYEKMFEDRCGELRYYYAKSAYLQIAQGIRKNSRVPLATVS